MSRIKERHWEISSFANMLSNKAAALSLKLKELIELHVGLITPRYRGENKTLDITSLPREVRYILYRYVMKWLFYQAKVDKNFRNHYVMKGVIHIVKHYLFVDESELIPIALRQGAVIWSLTDLPEGSRRALLSQVNHLLQHLPRIKSLLWVQYMVASELLYLNEHYNLQQEHVREEQQQQLEYCGDNCT